MIGQVTQNRFMWAANGDRFRKRRPNYVHEGLTFALAVDQERRNKRSSEVDVQKLESNTGIQIIKDVSLEVSDTDIKSTQDAQFKKEQLEAEQKRQEVKEKEKEAFRFQIEEEQAQINAGIMKVGNIVKFGQYPQGAGSDAQKQSIEWLVLDVQKGNGLGMPGRSLLISRYALDAKEYNEDYEDVTWETCTLRRWLNQDFLKTAFTLEEEKRILTVESSLPDNTEDQVFLLSLFEAVEYFKDDDERICIQTEYALAKVKDIMMPRTKVFVRG